MRAEVRKCDMSNVAGIILQFAQDVPKEVSVVTRRFFHEGSSPCSIFRSSSIDSLRAKKDQPFILGMSSCSQPSAIFATA